jgi:hypothetical protein
MLCPVGSVLAGRDKGTVDLEREHRRAVAELALHDGYRDAGAEMCDSPVVPGRVDLEPTRQLELLLRDPPMPVVHLVGSHEERTRCILREKAAPPLLFRNVILAATDRGRTRKRGYRATLDCIGK